MARSLLLALLFAPSLALAEPSAQEVLTRADAIMAPDEFESDVTMTSHKGSAPDRVIRIHLWKKGATRTRVRLLAPPDDAGQEVLRDGDNHWNYLPNLKRALRISPKQEFHGGDFNNTDILRVNLADDYTVTKLASSSPDEILLELRAKNESVSYDMIKYWVRANDFMPLRQEFYTKSGKMIRKLELLEPKKFDKHIRPSHLVMHNLLAPSRSTEIAVTSFVVKRGLSEQLFQLASLGQ